jgi:hypothetical protein
MPSTQLASLTPEALKKLPPTTLRAVGDFCFIAGFASIAASIAAWSFKKGTDSDAKAERFGIFIGLWAPTFFILSGRLERYADRAQDAVGGSAKGDASADE